MSTVNSITEAKNLIVNKLKADSLIDLEKTVLEFGRIEDFKSVHAKGSAVVYYAGSVFADESAGSTIVKQSRNIRIGVFVQIRTEHGNSYKDEMIDKIIQSAAGLKFKAVTKMDRVKPTSDEYLSPEQEEKFLFYEHLIIFTLPAQFQQTNNIS